MFAARQTSVLISVQVSDQNTQVLGVSVLDVTNGTRFDQNTLSALLQWLRMQLWENQESGPKVSQLCVIDFAVINKFRSNRKLFLVRNLAS